MERHRVRIRFRKEGALRLIGHRDLARAWERVFRRAGLEVRMSEGFHPKPRLSFPSALAMGVAGLDEVLDAELTGPHSPEALLAALTPRLVEGLSIKSIEVLPAEGRASRVERVAYELPIPGERQAALAERLARWPEAATAERARGAGQGGRKPVDLADLVEHIELCEGVLRLEVKVSGEGTARPRELLAALGLDDLERQGAYFTRTAVKLNQ
ncbi:MAG TPA: TIGR03936 family radical SAM-associated protein [Pirellulales bacterium]|nr:TIGR03936 family radical SAM-associated protein [Pirellulales bacterium]